MEKPPVRIRAAEPRDRRSLEQIYAAVRAEIEPDSDSKYAADTAGEQIFVAEREGQIVGTTQLTGRPWLKANANNHAARSFYGKLGWTEEELSPKVVVLRGPS